MVRRRPHGSLKRGCHALALGREARPAPVVAAMPFRLGPFNLMDAQIVMLKFREPVPRQRLQRINRRLLLTWRICDLQWFCFWTLVLSREIGSRYSGVLGLELRFELGDADHLR
jgi:hypothetical protein